jgi:hypothetical protein
MDNAYTVERKAIPTLESHIKVGKGGRTTYSVGMHYNLLESVITPVHKEVDSIIEIVHKVCEAWCSYLLDVWWIDLQLFGDDFSSFWEA